MKYNVWSAVLGVILILVGAALTWLQSRGFLSVTGGLAILVPLALTMAMVIYVYFPAKGAKNAFAWFCATGAVSFCIWQFVV